MLNNRDIAMLIWLFVLFIILLLPKFRGQSLKVIKSFLHWKLLIPNIIMLAYIWLIIFFIYKLGFWDTSLLKDSILFSILSISSLFMRVATNNEPQKAISKVFFDLIKITVVIKFIVNLTTHSLAFEILIVPVTFFIGSLVITAENNEEYKFIRKTLYTIESLIYIYILASSIFRFIEYLNNNNIGSISKQFFFTPFLTVLLIPFLAISLYLMLCERLNIFIKRNRALSKPEKNQLFFSYIYTSKLNLKKMNKYIHSVVYHPLFINSKNQIKEMEKFHMHQSKKNKEKELSSYNEIQIILVGIFIGALIGTINSITIINKYTLLVLSNSKLVLISYIILIILLNLFFILRRKFSIIQLVLLSSFLWLGSLISISFSINLFKTSLLSDIINQSLMYYLFTLIISVFLFILIKSIKKLKAQKYFDKSLEVIFSSDILPCINNNLINGIQEIKNELDEDLLVLNRVYFYEDLNLNKNEIILKLNGIEKEKIEINRDKIYIDLPKKIKSFVKEYRGYYTK